MASTQAHQTEFLPPSRQTESWFSWLSPFALQAQQESALKKAFSRVFSTSQRIETRPQKSPSENLSSNFHLFDVLVSFAEALPTQKDSPETSAEQLKQLELTLQAQLEAALAEHIKAPYHSEANEVDLFRLIATGELHIYHPAYPDRDLISFCQKALEAHSQETYPAHHARYKREKEQLETLYSQKLLPEILSQNPEQTWMPSPAGQILPHKIRERYQLTDPNETIYLGQKHAFAFPLNREVYPEGMSYLNIYQLAYLPRQEKMILLMDQFYNEWDLEVHAAVLQTWQPEIFAQSSSPLQKSESEIMQAVATLPEEIRASSTFEIFAGLAEQYQTQALPDSIAYRTKQQSSLGFLSQSKEGLNQSATFLTHILVTEYLLCQERPQLLNSLPQRLRVAFEMAMHPLLQGKVLPYEQALQAYQDEYWAPWQSQSQDFNQIQIKKSAKTLQQLSALQKQREILDQPLSQRDSQQRNTVLQNYAQSYPGILKSIAGNAMCMSGSLGGLSHIEGIASSSLGQSVLGGHLLNQKELISLIGQDRAQEWKMGICINPDCHNAGKEQLVGECSLCYRCELEFQIKEALQNSELTGDSDSPFSFGNRRFFNPEEVARAYREKLQANDFVPFIIGGESILR